MTNRPGYRGSWQALGFDRPLLVFLGAARPGPYPGTPPKVARALRRPKLPRTLLIQIKSATFADGSTSKRWAVVCDFGAKAEVNQYCPSYGGPFCIYPWFSSTQAGAFHYGVDFRDTVKN